MSFFENVNIKKGWNTRKRFIYISIGIIVVSILSLMWGMKIVEDKTRETYDLETVNYGILPRNFGKVIKIVKGL